MSRYLLNAISKQIYLSERFHVYQVATNQARAHTVYQNCAAPQNPQSTVLTLSTELLVF